MPVRGVDRPLTLLEDHFGIEPDVFVTAFDDEAIVGLFLGAGYGVTDDFEVGLTLIRVLLASERFADTTGLDAPTGYIEYRLIDGLFELSLFGQIELPLDDRIDYRAAIPMRLHLPPLLMLDVEPNAGGYIAAPGTIGVELPAELRVQIVDRFSISALGALSWPDLRVSRGALVRAGGRAAVTIVREDAALAEIRLTGMSRGIAIGAEAGLPRPIGTDWTVLIDATVYFRSDPGDAWPDSPF